MAETTITPTAPEAQAQHQPKKAKPADKHGWWWGTGRRKTAVARVRMRPSKDGKPIYLLTGTALKEKPVEEYFAEERDRVDCLAPLKLTDTFGKMEIRVRVHGGGFMGQAQATRLGLARALVAYDPTLEGVLRDNGMLTRDSREVERKKYGQAGARRRFQFSKR